MHDEFILPKSRAVGTNQPEELLPLVGKGTLRIADGNNDFLGDQRRIYERE